MGITPVTKPPYSKEEPGVGLAAVEVGSSPIMSTMT
jgi:hypothetical protein